MMGETNESDKLLFTLAYPIGLIGLILVITRKDEHDAKYHGFNSLFLWLAVLIINFVLGMVPLIGWMLIPLVSFAAFVYSIVLALQAYKGEFPVIPVITDFAKKYVESV